MSKLQNLYLGKAGQFIVMGELLSRGWNVAVPEVDKGDDIFVVRDENGEFTRVQVKTAYAKGNKTNGFSAQFNIPLKQLKTAVTPQLVYIFVIRFNEKWQDFIIISREQLEEEFVVNNVGTKQVKDNKLVLTIRLKGSSYVCSNQNWDVYKNNFSWWPKILH